MTDTALDATTAILVLTRIGSHNYPPYEREFIEFAVSAGIKECGILRCGNLTANPTYFIGRGKSEELRAKVEAAGVSLAVIDCELNPRQIRNLEARIKARILDRTALILDIFAQRARSHEGKLQVEFAQLEYLSTRLVRTWTHLERQKGGIGLRGPGEKQLETDRRLLRRRIKVLGTQLEKIKHQRNQRRRKRCRHLLPSVSLVGYTNVGKSTLFNALSDADVVSSKRLFATLDPTVRKVDVRHSSLLLSDTVGFIRNLPHQLINAFNATLLEICESNLILHVEDVSAEQRFEQRREVNRVLSAVGAGEIPVLTVFNKIDRVDLPARIERGAENRIVAVYLSAATGVGLGLLKRALAERMSSARRIYQLCVPETTADLRSFLYRNGTVFEERYEPGKGWFMRFELPDEILLRRFQKRACEDAGCEAMVSA